ncbi:chaperonin [Pantoea ananatis]|uniref:chaperonin n=1 Tax=Pantoea ananas TaxID=553 RepID=UPI002221CA4B|nr:chaperonin [Pantoea ananatis]MCW1834815.1 chaperonin [Pantoea ananatis]
MNSISERIKHVRIEKGYCLLCGQFSKLSKDHVPPKSAITLTPMLQKTITEWWGNDSIKPIDAVSGTVFKTICKQCNNEVLGSRDHFISDVTQSFTEQLKLYKTYVSSVSNYIKVPFNSVEFTKAMLGHLIAASSVDECKQPLIDTPFFSPLRKFVLGLEESFEDTHDIYYWFYPNRAQITARHVLFRNNGHNCICSALHFFPISFLVTFKGEGTFPVQAVKLDLKDRNLHFNVSMRNADYVTFPFVPLKGDSMIVFNSGYTYVSYPAMKD